MDNISSNAAHLSDLRNEKHFWLNEANDVVLEKLPSNSIDLVLTSPPYNIGKSYESRLPLEQYLAQQNEVIEALSRVLSPGANVAWQVGFTKINGDLVPLEYLLYPLFLASGFRLRNRIIWSFGHGVHASKRFSGRHEAVMIFSKDPSDSYFDLDAVRVPQKYPEKKHYKGPKKGELSGNPLGKNPGDVWDIPNVKAHHVEKTTHDCQFPIALAQRLIRAYCPVGGLVFDPYAGVGTTNCAAELEGRRSVGCEVDKSFFNLGLKRLTSAIDGSVRYRPLEKPVFEPGQK